MNAFRVLLLEDNIADAELLEYYLRKEGLSVTTLRVETEVDFKKALDEFKPDIILSDYNLPSYDGRAALNHVQQFHPDIPVIIVSGAIGEEKAVELLRSGARDYILKESLIRLPSAILRVLKEQDEINMRRETERKLRESEERHRLLVENSPMCIHEIDLKGRIISMNKAGLNMMGLKEESQVKGIHYLDAVCDGDRKRIEDLMTEAYSGQTSQFEFRASGARLQIFKSCFVPIKDKKGDVEKLMGITEDVTKQKMDETALQKSERYFRQLADYDTLTKLPNRRLLKDRLKQAMVTGKRKRRYGALMFLDLDNFKPLNDRHGHSTGDLLLIEVARRINGCVREVDTVSRFGGDEFIVMLSDIDKDKTTAINVALTVAEKIRIVLEKPYLLVIEPEGKEEITIEHRCSASIGVVLFVNNEHSTDDLLNWADIAMYRAKTEGRNRVNFLDIDRFT